MLPLLKIDTEDYHFRVHLSVAIITFTFFLKVIDLPFCWSTNSSFRLSEATHSSLVETNCLLYLGICQSSSDITAFFTTLASKLSKNF